ncbi:host attachment protein [Ensifer sp. IC3342]|nr:host attachment protein [Ensifer sp. BRP08]MCA1450829.1 host attachment protein [Ensifer sp. IC3342]
MLKTRIPHKSWVLVCDGAKALVLRNEGDAELLNLIPVDVAFEHRQPTRMLGTDRAGRVYQSEGGARSAMQQTDWHDQAEETFVSHVAEKLETVLGDHGVSNLVLIAPPRALGILRKRLRPSTRAMVIAEVAKDLAKFPIPEIEQHLSD